jgi:hypothetical protein
VSNSSLLNNFTDQLRFNRSSFQSEIDLIKNNTTVFVKNLLRSANLSKSENSSIVLGSPIYAVQISSFSDGAQFDMIIEAKKNRLPYINMTSCEKIIREKYHIDDKRNLILKSTQMSSSLNIYSLNDNYMSDYFYIALYDHLTGVFYNLSQCNETFSTIKFPLKSESKLNIPLYRQLEYNNVDIYNANDTAFISRCKMLRDNLTEYDTTINFRRKNYYQNLSSDCGTSCTYQGIDDSEYIICNCSSLHPEENYQQIFLDVILNSLPTINLDIMGCFIEVFFQVFSNLIIVD